MGPERFLAVSYALVGGIWLATSHIAMRAVVGCLYLVLSAYWLHRYPTDDRDLPVARLHTPSPSTDLKGD